MIKSSMLISFTLLLMFVGCKEEEIPEPKNTIGNDIEAMVSSQGVEFINVCFPTWSCIPDFGNEGYKDFDFPGDHFLRLGSQTYNLNFVKSYEVRSLKEKDVTEVWMTIHFNE